MANAAVENEFLYCTKIPVSLENGNYENFSAVTMQTIHDYKLGVLYGLLNDSVVIGETVFGMLKTHDRKMCRKIMDTTCFHENNIFN